MFKFNKHHNPAHQYSTFNQATTSPHQMQHFSSSILEGNPLGQQFEIGKLVGSAGPEHVWKIYDAWRKSDGKEVSLFVFEKKSAEKLHKPRRKETIAEILRSSVRQLERFRHPKILQVVHPSEECQDTLAFTSEPVMGSLANLVSPGSSNSNNISHGGITFGNDTSSVTSGHSSVRSVDCASSSNGSTIQSNSSKIEHPIFLEIELKYGILQIIEALQFLHYSGRVLHRNITPTSVLVTKRGTWKLAGLEFIDRANEIDGLEPIPVPPWTSKIPKMGQPELDYTAPEVQLTSTCSIMSDMFSLGMLITAIFNSGKSIVQSNHSNSAYLKQIENLECYIKEILRKIPSGLHEAVQRLLSKEPRQRPTSQLLALIKYFADPTVHTLQYLDVISMKDPTQKANFYRHQLKEVLPFVPKKLWFQHVWPALQQEMKTQEVLAAALQPILLIIQECSTAEYEKIILPFFRQVFSAPKSIQATVTLLENLNIIAGKSNYDDLLNKDILPMLFNSFDSSTIQVQNAALISTSIISQHLDEASARKIILPKTKAVYEKYPNDLKIIRNVLLCLESILDKLERPMIIEEVLPILNESVKLQDPDIILNVVQIYKLMISDTKKYGFSINLMATRVMPSLLPQTVNPSLNLDQFCSLLELLQEILEHIDRNQRNKLKLDHLSGPSQGQSDYLCVRQNSLSSSKPLRHQRSTDNMVVGSLGNTMFVPNVQIDYLPHSGGSQTCQRKTSSAEDMMMRKNSTEIYSDGTYLRVHGQSQFPIRRLSDNTLMAPKIKVATSSALSSPGEPLPIRRHSSIGPQERKNSTVNVSPPMGGSMPNTSSVPFLSSSTSNLKLRRSSIMHSSNSSMNSSNQGPLAGSGILQQLGSGVVSMMKKL